MPTNWSAMTQAQLLQLATNVAISIVIIIVAYFVAKAVKWGIAKAVDRIPFFPKHEAPRTRIGERVGEVGYWVVWLIAIIGVLTVLGLNEMIAPLNDMARAFTNSVPNIVGAALIFLIGFALATVVRRMVEAAVQAIELDRRLLAVGLTHTPQGPGLARLLGLLVFTLIIIPVSIAALQRLGINSIADPAIDMLRDIMSAIPKVIGAGLIVFIAYLIGRWVSTLAEEGLHSIGFDNIIRSIGSAEIVREGVRTTAGVAAEPSIAPAPSVGMTPSRVVGVAILASIVLVAAVQAAEVLEFGALTAMLAEVVALATRVLFGAVIIGAGVLIANILSAAAARGGGPSSEIMSVLVRWGVIALATAMGLTFMQIGQSIITIAFALILGSVAVAVAIAFGVGGRDAAKRLLDRWTSRTP